MLLLCLFGRKLLQFNVLDHTELGFLFLLFLAFLAQSELLLNLAASLLLLHGFFDVLLLEYLLFVLVPVPLDGVFIYEQVFLMG